MEALRYAKTPTWKELNKIKYGFLPPFEFHLADGHTFSVEKTIRLIAKKRLIGFGTWRDKPIFVKLFFHKKHAKLHINEDVTGVKLLQKNHITTPQIYHQGVSPDGRIHVLLFEHIVNAKNLREIWCSKQSIEELLPLLQSLVVEIAEQHMLGILQHDLNLKNYLILKDKIYTIDGAHIEQLPREIDKKVSMNNIARLFSYLGVEIEDYQESLFSHYAATRNWILTNNDFVELDQLVKKWNESRWHIFAKKIFTESRDFFHIKNWRMTGVFDRSHGCSEFMEVMRNPEILFKHPTAKILKSGLDSKIVKVNLGREYVVRCYNQKKKLKKPTSTVEYTSTASLSWRLAHKLNLFNIQTAKPVAFIEKKFLGMPIKSYYITEFVAGEDTKNFFLQDDIQKENNHNIVTRVSLLLKNVAKLNIKCEEIKDTHIFINSQKQAVMVDLERAVEHVQMTSYYDNWHQTANKFLKNFHDLPHVYEEFKKALANVASNKNYSIL